MLYLRAPRQAKFGPAVNENEQRPLAWPRFEPMRAVPRGFDVVMGDEGVVYSFT